MRDFIINSTGIDSDGITVYGTYSRNGVPNKVKFIVEKINGTYRIVKSRGLSAFIDSPLMTYCFNKGYIENDEKMQYDEQIDEVCSKYQNEFDQIVEFVINDITEKFEMVKNESEITVKYDIYAEGHVTIYNGSMFEIPYGSMNVYLSLVDNSYTEITRKNISITEIIPAFTKFRKEVYLTDISSSNFNYGIKIEVKSKEIIERFVAENASISE
jgi:hypothetical protein